MSLWKRTDLVASAPKFGAQLVSSGSGKANLVSNTNALYVNATANSFNNLNANNKSFAGAVGMFAVSQAERANTTGEGPKVTHPGWNLRRVWEGPVTSVTITAGGSGYANGAMGKFYPGSATGLVNCYYTITTNSTGGIVSATIGNPGRITNASAMNSNIMPANTITAITVSSNGLGYVNGDVIVISNGLINTWAIMVTNSTGGANTIGTFIYQGAGFVNATAIAYTVVAGPNVQIGSITVGNPGRLFSNGDKVTFTGAGAAWKASGNLTTNIIGGIVSVNLSNNGLGFDSIKEHVTVAYTNSTGGTTNGINASLIPNFVVTGSNNVLSTFGTGNGIASYTVSAGGTGYNNTDILTASNGVINATATISTNSTGGIGTVTVVTNGRGFPGAGNVAITFANATGGASGGSAATIVPVLSNVAITVAVSGGTGATIAAVLGGRAKRITYENIVAMANMASSNGSGSTIFPH